MYVIRVALQVREDARETFESHAQAETAEVPKRFDGCVRYGFHTLVGEPTSFLLYEEWRDQASFEAYRDSQYFTEIGERIRPLLAAPPDSAYYQVEAPAPGAA
ncbi:putative quinol monooxygenase [Haliangium sp.]|uniref:putative quinol monooxygenase n=1 Tax=Haliangium sp. TaxID=2663208 RepID=UPI003D0F616E